MHLFCNCHVCFPSCSPKWDYSVSLITTSPGISIPWSFPTWSPVPFSKCNIPPITESRDADPDFSVQKTSKASKVSTRENLTFSKDTHLCIKKLFFTNENFETYGCTNLHSFIFQYTLKSLLNAKKHSSVWKEITFFTRNHQVLWNYIKLHTERTHLTGL